MNTLQHSRINGVKNDGGHFLLPRLKAFMAVFNEWFWFCLSFILFLVMGPFSAVVVLIGLVSLGSEERRSEMTEPARL